jgi:hypothetical protein
MDNHITNPFSNTYNQQPPQEQARGETLEDVLRTMQGHIERQELVIRELQSQGQSGPSQQSHVTTNQEQMELLTKMMNQLSNNTSQGPRQPRQSLPPASKYDGEDKTLFSGWVMELKAKLAIDGKAIGDEQAQFYYIFTRLEGKAKIRMEAWTQRNMEAYAWSVAGFFLELDRVFRDSRQIERAIWSLSNTGQGEKTMDEYIAETNRYIAEAVGSGWDSTVKKGYLRHGINKKVLEKLIGRDEPADYEAYCGVVRQVYD